MNNSFRWSSGAKSKEPERNHRCFNLAFLYFKNNDLDAAEKCARDSIAVDDTYRGHKLLGDILLAKKRRDEALLEYQRSIELNPSQEEAYIKVCELLSSSESCDVDSLRYWCERAERNNLMDVVDQFQQAIESGVAFPGRVHMNTVMKNVSMKNLSLTNGSSDVLDTSRGSRSGADLSKLSLNDSSNTMSPARVIPSPAERAILSKVNSQEVLLKNILSQQEKLLDTHRILMQEILANRGSIDTLRTEMSGLKSSVAEVKAFAGALGTMSAKLNDINESQKELKDIVYELNLNNYNDEEYEDVGEDQENNRPAFEPISPALNVSNLPNFGHMNISGIQQQQQTLAQNNMNKTPSLNQGVFSRLGDKASTPIQSPAQPVAPSAPILAQRLVAPTSKLQAEGTASSVLARPSFAPAKTVTSATSSMPTSSNASEKEVEVVYQRTPSKDLVDKAKSLELPQNFYNYLDKPDCQGCRGCEKEGTTTVTSTIASLSSTTATTSSSAGPKTMSVLASSSKPLFGVAPVSSSAVNSSTATSSTTAVAASVFGKPSMPSSSEKPFSFGFQLNPPTSSSAPVFGSTSSGGTPSTVTSLFNLPSLGACESGTDAPKFSFGFGSASSTGSAFGSSSSGTGLFSAAVKETVGADCANSGFKWGGNSDGSKPKWMVDTPSQIFGQKICEPNEEGDDDENPEEDSVDDNLFVLPTVELPDHVEIKTGEEDEDIIYCQRAKLFRFDQPTKQWKERGIGDLKILKHQKVPNRYRIVLRREQVHKIACNHYLTSAMKFAPMTNSETSVCWFAKDFADEEYADEQFAVKFKNKEILNVFTDKISELQALMAETEGKSE